MSKCKLCTCPNCMAGYEAEAYEYAVQVELAEKAYDEIQRSIADLLTWSTGFGPKLDEETDAEKVAEWVETEVTWKDKWDRLWR